MTQQGYQPGAERAWWWKIAKLLDETQIASISAMAHNLDDPTRVRAFVESIRQAQVILLEILHTKGLLPSQANGTLDARTRATLPAGPPPQTQHQMQRPPMPPVPSSPPAMAPPSTWTPISTPAAPSAAPPLPPSWIPTVDPQADVPSMASRFADPPPPPPEEPVTEATSDPAPAPTEPDSAVVPAPVLEEAPAISEVDAS